MAFDDPATGRKWLYWGSAHLPIRVQELADDRVSFKAGTHPVDIVSAHREFGIQQADRRCLVALPERILLFVLFGRQLLWRQSQLRRDGVARTEHQAFEGFQEVSGEGSVRSW